MTDIHTRRLDAYTPVVAAALILAVLFIAGPAVSAAAQDDPPEGFVELEMVSRLFLDVGEWDPMAELVGRFEGEKFEFGYRALTLGSYYRFHENVKAGAFYRVQQGARHDEDWDVRYDGDLKREKTTDRTEHVLIGDVTPRFLFDFLPGEDWVFAVKNRYHFNTYNSNQSLLIRPQLTYFWVENREPVLNVTGAYGVYLALNFSDQLVYEHTPYVDVIYHLTDATKLNAGAAYKTVHYAAEADSNRWDDSDYSADQSTWLLRAGVIFRLGI
jgi:hypothetical protein